MLSLRLGASVSEAGGMLNVLVRALVVDRRAVA